MSESHSAVSVYADDTTIITHCNSNIINAVFKILDAFAMVSGLKVNKEKTQVMPIGINNLNCQDIDNLCTTRIENILSAPTSTQLWITLNAV